MIIKHFNRNTDQENSFNLKDGMTVRYREGGPTEEGYHYIDTDYWLEGDDVFCRIIHTSCDCDGPLNSDDLYKMVDGIWQHIRGECHDEYAERMGY